MKYLCFCLQAHQPRRFKKKPNLNKCFNDTLNEEIFLDEVQRSYLPVNRALKRLFDNFSNVRFSLGLSGSFLEQVELYSPELADSFQQLLTSGGTNVEFLAQTYYQSLVGMFTDYNKEEFKTQLKMHQEMIKRIFGRDTLAVRNTELLNNSSNVEAIEFLGYRSIFCDISPKIAALFPNNYYFGEGDVRVIGRNRELSDTLCSLLQCEDVDSSHFGEWLQGIEQKLSYLNISYEGLAGGSGDDELIYKNLQSLVTAMSEQVEFRTLPLSKAAKKIAKEECVLWEQLPQVSCTDEGPGYYQCFNNRAQRELFRAYQDMETRVKTIADNKLLDIWRYFGTADNFYCMTSQIGKDEYDKMTSYDYYEDVSEAILQNSFFMAKLENVVYGLQKSIQIKKQSQRPRILLVTPEVTELPSGFGNLANFISAKGGGLADISAALIAEMVKMGLDIHVAMPKYDRQMCKRADVSHSELDRIITLFKNTDPIHLAQDFSFKYLKNVYEKNGMNTALHRANAFQRVVINQIFDEAIPSHGKMLVHCNDWMTGLIPAAASSRGLRSLFTLHNTHTAHDSLRNLEDGGIDVARFWKDLYLADYPYSDAPWEKVTVDYLLSGVKAADHVNTVSHSFLLEIISGYFPDLFSWRLRDELRAKHQFGSASGILNAPKSNVSPKFCSDLKQNFDEKSVMEGKRANKVAFQESMGLMINPNAPLFFWPHRLFMQKGPHLLRDIAVRLIEEYARDGLQIAIVGNGDSELEKAFGIISCGSSGRIAYQHFNSSLSELGKAAADFIIMPSLYEPCGLPQMEGMRYGTLPIVRATGGLRDTVQHLDIKNGVGNGFVFNDFLSSALWWACGEAMKFYRLPVKKKERILQNVMRYSYEVFNLEKTTLQYINIYEKLLGEKLI